MEAEGSTLSQAYVIDLDDDIDVYQTPASSPRRKASSSSAEPPVKRQRTDFKQTHFNALAEELDKTKREILQLTKAKEKTEADLWGANLKLDQQTRESRELNQKLEVEIRELNQKLDDKNVALQDVKENERDAIRARDEARDKLDRVEKSNDGYKEQLQVKSAEIKRLSESNKQLDKENKKCKKEKATAAKNLKDSKERIAELEFEKATAAKNLKDSKERIAELEMFLELSLGSSEKKVEKWKAKYQSLKSDVAALGCRAESSDSDAEMHREDAPPSPSLPSRSVSNVKREKPGTPPVVKPDPFSSDAKGPLPPEYTSHSVCTFADENEKKLLGDMDWEKFSERLKKVYPNDVGSSRYHANAKVGRGGGGLKKPHNGAGLPVWKVDSDDEETDKEVDREDDDCADDFQPATEVSVTPIPSPVKYGVALPGGPDDLVLCGPQHIVDALLAKANRLTKRDELAPIFIPTRRREDIGRLKWTLAEEEAPVLVVEKSDYSEYHRRYPGRAFLVIPDAIVARIGQTRRIIQRFAEHLNFELVFMADDLLQRFVRLGAKFIEIDNGQMDLNRRQGYRGQLDSGEITIIDGGREIAVRVKHANGVFKVDSVGESEWKPWLTGKTVKMVAEPLSKRDQTTVNKLHFLRDNLDDARAAFLDLQREMIDADKNILVGGVNVLRISTTKSADLTRTSGGEKNSAKFTKLFCIRIRECAVRGVRFQKCLHFGEDLVFFNICRCLSEMDTVLKRYRYTVKQDRRELRGGCEDAREAAKQRRRRAQAGVQTRSQKEVFTVYCGGEEKELARTLSIAHKKLIEALHKAWPEN